MENDLGGEARLVRGVRRRDAAALAGRYVEDLSVGDLAARLGRSYKATESVLSRARVAFRRALERVDADEA